MMPVRLGAKKRNKFNARKVVVDGIKFDSQAEARRYTQLCVLQKSGFISGLAVHPELRIEINGIEICKVLLDFSYRNNKTGKMVWEDVKGRDTPVSKLKRKMVKAAHDVHVELVK